MESALGPMVQKSRQIINRAIELIDKLIDKIKTGELTCQTVMDDPQLTEKLRAFNNELKTHVKTL